MTLDATKHPLCGKAYAYAQQVIDGELLACKWVRLACERFLRDLERAETDAFPYRWDCDKAERVMRFAQKLPHVKGRWARKDPKSGQSERLKLEPWQCFILGNIFGWVKKSNGFRRFNRASIYVPRKNGKSFFACVIGWWMFAKDNEPGAEVYCGATTEAQAWEVFRPARQLGIAEPDLPAALGVQIFGSAMKKADDGSRFEPVIGKPGDGASPHCAIVDEYHEHLDPVLHDTMKTGMGAREQPLLLVISTAGDNLAGPCREDWRDCEKLLENAFEDETKFTIIFTIDIDNYSQVVQSSTQEKAISSLCKTHNVETTQINKRLLYSFAKDVIQSIDVSAKPVGASTTLIGKFEAEVYAALATSGSYSSKILKGLLEKRRHGNGGTEKIKTASKRISGNGGESLETLERSVREREKADTESQILNLRLCQNLSLIAAEYAKSPNPFAWITVIRQALSEVFSAEPATAQSVRSEILTSLLEELATIWPKLRGWEIQESGRCVLEFNGDDWTTEAALRKANPNWGVSINPELILVDQQNAIRDPAKQAVFKTKHLDIWVNARNGWLNMEKWNACAEPALRMEDFAGQPCWVGIDAAAKIDVFSMVAVFERDDCVVAFARHFMPEETIALPHNKHMQKWVAQGHLTATPGARTDQMQVESVLREWSEKFYVQEVAYDPKEISYLMNQVRLWAGFPCIEMTQGPTLVSEPMKELEAKINTGKLRHAGCPVLTWMASNVIKKEARGGGPVKYYYPAKERAENKIDGMVALIMALSRQMAQQGSAGVGFY